MVRMWFGVSTSTESGDIRFSAVRGRLLITASASHMKVRRASSLSCVPFVRRSAERRFRTVRICLSQTPPMWLAFGTLNFIWTQSQFSFRSSAFTLSGFISDSACLSSRLAPQRLLPWSLLSCLTGPRRHTKRRRALM